MTTDTKQAEVLTTYKGFDKNLQCRGFQYEVGKTYEHKGSVSACKGGFHACENPLDVFSYYGAAKSRFALVEQEGDLSKDGNDTKVASRRITIKAELSLAGIIKASIKYTQDLAGKPNSGDSANAATSGNSANAATSGYYAHAATSGNSANAATSGYYARVETKAKNAVAANAGNGKARAGVGGAIFIVERDDQLNILAVFASKVGENGIEPDHWYELRGGKPVEVSE